jgi:predicted acetyltransferase
MRCDESVAGNPVAGVASVNPVDYDFADLDLSDESEAARTRLRGWIRAMRHAFREGRPDEDLEKLWIKLAQADDQTVSGAWLPEGAFGDRDVPVATFATFDKSINLGHEVLPARLITDVTASPAHRRRGLVRRLMEDALDRAVADGMPLAALTVSEATIYGRWGFGVATLRHRVELDTRPGFGLRDFTDPGRVEIVDIRTSWALFAQVFERFHAQTRGSVALPAFYEPYWTGVHDFQSGEDKALQAAVHLDADEHIDGFAIWRPESKDDVHGVRLAELVAVDDAAELALWDFLAGIDLATKVTFWAGRPDSPLPWALTDFNRLKTVAVAELLWARVLDVPRVLAARPWAADGEVVLEVADPQGHAAGRWSVTTRGGHATVAATDAESGVRMDAETLSTLAFGTATVDVLHRAGRLSGDAIGQLAAMADLPSVPYAITAF